MLPFVHFTRAYIGAVRRFHRHNSKKPPGVNSVPNIFVSGNIPCCINENFSDWNCRPTRQTPGLRFFILRIQRRSRPGNSVHCPVPAHAAFRGLPVRRKWPGSRAAGNLQARAILLRSLYSAGIQRSELQFVRWVEDIDSKLMIVHIRHGKGGKDRDVRCAPEAARTLR